MRSIKIEGLDIPWTALTLGCLQLAPSEMWGDLCSEEEADRVVKTALEDHPEEKEISLLAISVSHLEEDAVLQLELPFELEDEERRPGTAKGAARWVLDRSVDSVRDKFGRESVGYGSVELGERRSIPDGFRELAEKEL